MTEERARIHTRISLETQRKMETAMPPLAVLRLHIPHLFSIAVPLGQQFSNCCAVIKDHPHPFSSLQIIELFAKFLLRFCPHVFIKA